MGVRNFLTFFPAHPWRLDPQPCAKLKVFSYYPTKRPHHTCTSLSPVSRMAYARTNETLFRRIAESLFQSINVAPRQQRVHNAHLSRPIPQYSAFRILYAISGRYIMFASVLCGHCVGGRTTRRRLSLCSVD